MLLFWDPNRDKNTPEKGGNRVSVNQSRNQRPQKPRVTPFRQFHWIFWLFFKHLILNFWIIVLVNFKSLSVRSTRTPAFTLLNFLVPLLSVFCCFFGFFFIDFLITRSLIVKIAQVKVKCLKQSLRIFSFRVRFSLIFIPKRLMKSNNTLPER